MPEKLDNHLETYKIEKELEQDDLTIAYLAHRKSNNEPVLIKVVGPQFTFDRYFVRRFKDAAARGEHLDHPNIIKTYEVGEREDLLYVAREWVEAQTLAEYLEAEGPLSLAKTALFVKQIAAALDYAHSKAIRHGDLSDINVLLNGDTVWVTDFGLMQSMEGTSLIKKGFAIGNPIYLSPERVRGESSSRTADLYALGILSYQMLTGRTPFLGEPASVLHAHAYEQPDPPHTINPNVSPAVSEVILRMLSKGLELRHSTGAEFARALQVAIDNGPAARPASKPTPVTSVVEPVSKTTPIWHRFAFWAFIITPLVGCALAGGFWLIDRWVILSAVPTPTKVVSLEDIPTVIPTYRVNVDTLKPGEGTQFPVVISTSTAATPTPLFTPTNTPAPTVTPLPAPGEAVVVEDSPFKNLVLARDITDNFEPVQVSNRFPPTEDPIYLFFDYEEIEPGASWGLVWKWDEIVLEENKEVWPTDYSSIGTAWVYYSPPLGFQPGPYSISLNVEGDTVATIDFVIEPQ